MVPTECSNCHSKDLKIVKTGIYKRLKCNNCFLYLKPILSKEDIKLLKAGRTG